MLLRRGEVERRAHVVEGTIQITLHGAVGRLSGLAHRAVERDGRQRVDACGIVCETPVLSGQAEGGFGVTHRCFMVPELHSNQGPAAQGIGILGRQADGLVEVALRGFEGILRQKRPSSAAEDAGIPGLDRK